MEQLRRTALAAACAVSLAATVTHADPQTPNFYGKKEKACRLHVAQNALTNVPATIAGKPWRDICNVANYPSLFTPGVQYPGVPACGSGAWPLCSTSPGPEPDLGYRYPLVANVLATATHQNPEVDWWSVCVRFDLTQIYSEPGVQGCGTGNFRQEIGRCVASAAYYENLNANQTKHPGEVFYEFVLTQPDCEPSGLGMMSVFETCKRTCTHYFHRMGFDQDGSDPEDPGAGVWRDEDDPVWASRPPGKQFADVALRNVPIAAGPYEGRTALDACKDFCGPPSTDCTPSSPGCVPAAHEAPPWVSQNETAQRPPEEKADQWHWTIYERGRNANDNISGTLRSYAVNTDHSTPTVECNGPIISRYCDTIITEPTEGGAGVTPKRVQCKKNLLPTFIDLDDDGQADGEIVLGEWNLSEDGFCDAFSHANMFCRDFCYDAGGNGEVTDNVCGYLDPATGLKLQLGVADGDCNDFTALCDCSNGSTTVPCISLCGNGPGAPGETGLQCDDSNVFDGDCCAANCQFEAVGGACEADGNGCTTGGTCNASHQCIETCNVGALCAPAGCGLVCELDGGNCVCQ